VEGEAQDLDWGGLLGAHARDEGHPVLEAHQVGAHRESQPFQCFGFCAAGRCEFGEPQHVTPQSLAAVLTWLSNIDLDLAHTFTDANMGPKQHQGTGGHRGHGLVHCQAFLQDRQVCVLVEVELRQHVL
jgi:hypothetical protein